MRDSWLVRMVTLMMLGLTCLPGIAEDSLHLGFHAEARREWTRTEVRTTFDLWAKELAKQFGLPVTISHYDDVLAMRDDLRSGKLDGVQTDIMNFVRHFRTDELSEGYVSIMREGFDLQLYGGRGRVSLKDMPGQRVVLLEEDQAGQIYLETLCMKHHRRACADVFAEMQTAPTSNQALMRVFFGKADMALVQSYGHALAVEMNPQLGRSLHKLAELPFRGQFYGFYSARVNPGLKERTLRIMPTLHTYPRGRQLLDTFKIDRLERASPEDLKPAYRLEREYRDLLASLGRRGGHR